MKVLSTPSKDNPIFSDKRSVLGSWQIFAGLAVANARKFNVEIGYFSYHP